MTDVTAPRCPSRVPQALCGGLKGDDRPRCTRRMVAVPDTLAAGPHGGKCKAHRSLPGVGKTEWTWKATAEHLSPVKIKLKRQEPIHARIAREASCRCNPEGIRHLDECDFAGLVMSSHHG